MTHTIAEGVQAFLEKGMPKLWALAGTICPAGTLLAKHHLTQSRLRKKIGDPASGSLAASGPFH